jgi:hypothetical protein
MQYPYKGILHYDLCLHGKMFYTTLCNCKNFGMCTSVNDLPLHTSTWHAKQIGINLINLGSIECGRATHNDMLPKAHSTPFPFTITTYH